MTRLVDDLLDVARINRGKISLDSSPLDLRTLLTAAVEAARSQLEARRHALQLQLPAEPLWVRGDAVRLSQVFGNLLHNAAKFTPPGGRITVEAVQREGRIEVDVSDDGTGIAPEVLAHVFELFTQADHALDRSTGGLGIGLSLVKTIVDLHGGEVTATSGGLGAGSSFRVSLPAGTAPTADAAPDAAESPRAAVEPTVLRVLVVDDNRDSVDAMAMLLESQGHAVQTATRSDTALQMAAAAPFDAVLLDIGLPEMNGYDVARAMRQLPTAHPPLLIAISGYGRDSDREQARAAGFDHHLVKPADPAEIFALLDTARR
jgi:CheY-like chemotaxis protein/anti-sigma regulatory factor (Ser/Thr protein kinase)